jgi:hypothetical protein
MGKVNTETEKTSKGKALPYEEIGKRLKWVFRGENALAVSKAIAGVSRQSMYRFYSGESFPSEELIIAVHKRGFSIDWLLFNVGEPVLGVAALQSVTIESEEEIANFLATFPDALLTEGIRRKPRQLNPSVEPQAI